MRTYKSYVKLLIVLTVLCILMYFTGEIILPFIIGLFCAYLINPLIQKIQKLIPNRNVSVTVFFAISLTSILSIVGLFGHQIVKDSERLNKAFTTFLDKNSTEIESTSSKIKSYIEKVYPISKIDKSFNSEQMLDSLSLNSEKIEQSFSSITSFFKSNDDEKITHITINWYLVFIYSICYFVYILYTYRYFENWFNKYFGDEKRATNSLSSIIYDFKNTFVKYFRQRSIVVIISSIIFITTFLLIGIPGAIIIGAFAGILCYIAHFHYLVLLPTALSCWVLSIEYEQSFFLYFGLIIAVLIIVSILEEFIFFPKIMTGVSSMNPAVMLVSLSFWSYLFGITGLFIALPLTTLISMYFNKILAHRKKTL